MKHTQCPECGMLSVMGGQPHLSTCARPEAIPDEQADIATLRQKLREYLRLGSCDGRVERKPLRKELAKLIGAEYDEKESRIK